MPISRPLITVPMTLPRCEGAASEEASTTTIWATTDTDPSINRANSRIGKLGAAAQAAATTAAPPSITQISRRRSSRSPIGTIRARPST